MFLHEAKQIVRKFLLLRPRTLDNSIKKVFSRCNFSENSMQVLLDSFQRAVIVFTIVLCRRPRCRRPRCLRFLLLRFGDNLFLKFGSCSKTVPHNFHLWLHDSCLVKSTEIEMVVTCVEDGWRGDDEEGLGRIY